MGDPRALLTHLWTAGVRAVGGREAVAAALERDGPMAASLVIAAGKAACSMFEGAAPCLSAATRSIVVSKHGHIDPGLRGRPGLEVIEAGHPLPDANSLIAGERILRAVSEAGRDDRLLLLISGGASATAEALQPGFDLDELQAVTSSLLGSGQSIHQVNNIRSRMSRLKGGRLLGAFRGREARVYALSDVRGDELAVIGGGIGDTRRARAAASARIVASNQVARDAAVREAEGLGHRVHVNEETLYADVDTLAVALAARLRGGPPGIFIWGGEPTVELPPQPGRGGRNQALALALATRIRGSDGISVLVAGTDGTDGPTNCAGAYVDGTTVSDAKDAEDALRRADSGTYLAARNLLFAPGPTGTNVMDLVVAAVA